MIVGASVGVIEVGRMDGTSVGLAIGNDVGRVVGLHDGITIDGEVVGASNGSVLG